jgi:hypothetical protein
MSFLALYLTHSEAGVQWEFKSMTDNGRPIDHSQRVFVIQTGMGDIDQDVAVVRQFPMIPGVDLAGTSSSPNPCDAPVIIQTR